jgi:hypothetical protein
MQDTRNYINYLMRYIKILCALCTSKVYLYYPDLRDLKSDLLSASSRGDIKYMTSIWKSKYDVSNISKTFQVIYIIHSIHLQVRSPDPLTFINLKYKDYLLEWSSVLMISLFYTQCKALNIHCVLKLICNIYIYIYKLTFRIQGLSFH